MSAAEIEFEVLAPEALARRFLNSLRQGRLVDALETLSSDATVSDGSSPDRHGLREITASLIPYRTPDRFVVERIEARGNTVIASVRVARGTGKKAGRYLARIETHAGRIRTVHFRPA